MGSKRFLKMKKNWKSLIRKCLSLPNVIKLLSEIKIKISVKIVKIFSKQNRFKEFWDKLPNIFSFGNSE